MSKARTQKNPKNWELYYWYEDSSLSPKHIYLILCCWAFRKGMRVYLSLLGGVLGTCIHWKKEVYLILIFVIEHIRNGFWIFFIFNYEYLSNLYFCTLPPPLLFIAKVFTILFGYYFKVTPTSYQIKIGCNIEQNLSSNTNSWRFTENQ